MKLRDLTYIALGSALMCVLSPLSIPIGIVPISLATLVVYLIGCLYSPLKAVTSVILYILLGLCGLPVFSKYQAGFSVLAGPTGGFILGYVLGVFVQSLFITHFKEKKTAYIIGIIFSTIIIYGFGLVWFMFVTNGKYSFQQAMMSCVYPFIPGDLLKLVIAVSISYKLRPISDRLQDTSKIRKTS